MRTIYINMSKARLLQILRSVPRAAQDSDALKQRIADALFAKIHEAFAVKSRGGTDETGDRWQPLAPSTKAKRLRGPDTRPSAGITGDQRDRWWDYYRRALWKFKDKSTAAKVAWATLRREGVIVQHPKYGHVDILRDSYALVRSLTPKVASPNKVLRFGLGTVELGTRRKWAWLHHSGGSRVPQRRLWPDPKNWTSSWWKEILEEARDGVVDVILSEVARA